MLVVFGMAGVLVEVDKLIVVLVIVVVINFIRRSHFE